MRWVIIKAGAVASRIRGLIPMTLSALRLSGCCISPPNPPLSGSVPDDLHIIYSDGACHAEWGRSEAIITTDDGNVSGDDEALADLFDIDTDKPLSDEGFGVSGPSSE